jgi:hypothetical protein
MFGCYLFMTFRRGACREIVVSKCYEARSRAGTRWDEKVSCITRIIFRSEQVATGRCIGTSLKEEGEAAMVEHSQSFYELSPKKIRCTIVLHQLLEGRIGKLTIFWLDLSTRRNICLFPPGKPPQRQLWKNVPELQAPYITQCSILSR